jgi:restriction endonuclease HindI-like protein
VLYSFRGDSFTGGSDGAFPNAGLIADKQGARYNEPRWNWRWLFGFRHGFQADAARQGPDGLDRDRALSFQRRQRRCPSLRWPDRQRSRARSGIISPVCENPRHSRAGWSYLPELRHHRRSNRAAWRKHLKDCRKTKSRSTMHSQSQSAVELMGNEFLQVIAHELLVSLKGSVTVDWPHRESARARMRILLSEFSANMVIRLIFRMPLYKPSCDKPRLFQRNGRWSMTPLPTTSAATIRALVD